MGTSYHQSSSSVVGKPGPTKKQPPQTMRPVPTDRSPLPANDQWFATNQPTGVGEFFVPFISSVTVSSATFGIAALIIAFPDSCTVASTMLFAVSPGTDTSTRDLPLGTVASPL